MATETELAEEFQRLCIDHGVVLSIPLLKLLAKKAKQQAKPSSMATGGPVNAPLHGSFPTAKWSNLGSAHYPYNAALITVKGTYDYLQVQQKLPLAAPESLIQSAKDTLFDALLGQATQKGFTLIGQPYIYLFKDFKSHFLSMKMSSHAIKAQNLPSAEKPWFTVGFEPF